jgi:hypothetical protein
MNAFRDWSTIERWRDDTEIDWYYGVLSNLRELLELPPTVGSTDHLCRARRVNR